MNENIQVFGTHDEGTLKQMQVCLAVGGSKAVLCADGHKGYAQPVGGVVAYKNLVSVSGVGYDIGCGNLAVKTDAKHEDIKRNIGSIMDDIVSNISFGMGLVNATPVEHALFEDSTWDDVPAITPLKELAQAQLGTVGGGNHYVDLFIDENNFVWIGIHFGSRGFGHKTASKFLALAGGKDGMDVAPTILKATTQLGSDYIHAMQLAGLYAKAGREYVASTVLNILKARSLDTVHNHHNFAWLENHEGENYWVVRKGATPAFPHQRGFVGGSMGDDAVILEGVDSELSRKALYSTVHGAGRVMSRSQAKGKFIKGVERRGGLVHHEDMVKWITEKGVTLRGGDVDEAPQVYRRLTDVLKAHEGTINVLHTLRPIGVAMAGKEVFDPYKD